MLYTSSFKIFVCPTITSAICVLSYWYIVLLVIGYTFLLLRMAGSSYLGSGHYDYYIVKYWILSETLPPPIPPLSRVLDFVLASDLLLSENQIIFRFTL